MSHENHCVMLLNMKKQTKTDSFLGLVSDGGAYLHTSHLRGLIDAAQRKGLNKCLCMLLPMVEMLIQNREKKYIEDLETYLFHKPAQLASVIIYYAMDRDKTLGAVLRLAYDLVVNGEGKHTTNLVASIQDSYDDNTTDEFIKPTVKVDSADQPIATIQDGDVGDLFQF